MGKRGDLKDVKWRKISPPCDDCGEQLSGKALEHGRQGFGHYRRCCTCYERRQRGEPPLRKR